MAPKAPTSRTPARRTEGWRAVRAEVPVLSRRRVLRDGGAALVSSSLIAPRLVLPTLAVPILTVPAMAQAPQRLHGLAMHGSPKHPAGFASFPYVNADAPKGGRLRLGRADSFDSLNPFIVKGSAPGELRDYVYESLMVRGADEPFTLYGHIAETVEVAADRSAITFNLHGDARFSDGAALTADDVLFSMTLLRQKGWPFFRNFYSKIASADVEGPRRIRFTFATDSASAVDREIPLIIGLMPILPKHRINQATFDQTSLVPPIGSGPYTVAEVEPGRLITFRRHADWWAKDRPTGRGRFNFAEISVEYIRDHSTLFEAFKAGQIDYRVEDDPNRWINGYSFRALSDGRVVRREIQSQLPVGFTAFVFNTRRPPFDDRRVREALLYAFDAEFINRTQFSGVYRRTQSIFERSPLSSFGMAADARELALLKPFAGEVLPDILEGRYMLPTTDGLGDGRASLAQAVRLFASAGYRLTDGRMKTPQGRALSFDFLALTTAQERLALAYARSLALIGVGLRIRQVDKAQYWDRLKNRDFDMIQNSWGATASPGNEQFNRWGSASADNPGSLNYAGIKSPAVDAMIAALLAAHSLEDFRACARALDRVLRSGAYFIPLFHLPRVFVAHQAMLGYPRAPAQSPTLGGIDLDTWWSQAPA